MMNHNINEQNVVVIVIVYIFKVIVVIFGAIIGVAVILFIYAHRLIVKIVVMDVVIV